MGTGWAVTVWPPHGNESQEEGDQRRGITSLGPLSLAVKSQREKETEQSVTPLNRSNSNEPVSLFSAKTSDALLPHTHIDRVKAERHILKKLSIHEETPCASLFVRDSKLWQIKE